MMLLSKNYCLLLLLSLACSSNLLPLLQAQNDNPPGFVSIDCGLPEGSEYSSRRGVYYTTDANFSNSGDNKRIDPQFIDDTPETYLSTVRSFPQGKRNCYTIKPLIGKGNKYLIRATFMYGNYDSLNRFPTFDLNLGGDTWSKIAIVGNESVERREIIHILSSDYVHVCLINTGGGTPFISALELRPLNSTNSMYTTISGSLEFFRRRNCYSGSNTIRYGDDIYDRRWRPFNCTKTGVSTNLLNNIANQNDYLVPKNVLRTASTPENISQPLQFSWWTSDTSDQFYVYMHFTEVEANQSREFNININGIQWNRLLVVPKYLNVATLFSTRPHTGNTNYSVSLEKTENSTGPPIINAYEIYRVKNFSDLGTNETDVAAILSIKSTYRVIRESWQGDPCEPQEFLWDGLKCSYQSSNSGNGTNTESCGSEPCKKKSSKSSIVVVGASVGSVLFLAVIFFGIWTVRRRIPQVVRKLGNHTQVNKSDIERKNRKYTYSEVLNITKNFERVLGKGGFGTVYHGNVGEIQVAVKMLSSSSTQGYKEFQTEASLLMNVSHKNLTSLVGYCNEGTHMGIIYEYMANRSLDGHLSGKSSFMLSWEMRLQIALDAAQGLEYLHHGCKPAIIHRDVKTSNILLNEQFQAKLADFGLSRVFPVEGGTHVSTVVAGSPGYLDPDYYTLSRLTEKSDVYSFGVVLLALITGRPAILETENRTHISQWVDSIVQYGDVKQVVDPRLRGKFDVNSVWKAVELAMTCATQISSRRPTMNNVVMELKECLAIEIGSHDAHSENLSGKMDMDLSSVPEPR